MQMRLRPHHGMCIPFYEGKGYSASFTDHMGAVIRDCAEDADRTVLLTVSTDAVCEACPENRAGVCASAEKVKRYDEAVLSLCGLSEGDVLPYTAFLKRVKEAILDKGKRRSICGDCAWNDVCVRHEARSKTE